MADEAKCSLNLHPELVLFKHPLPRFHDSLLRGRKTRVVAIGSSTTAGEGNVIPYPARLELAFRKRFPDRMIDVVNRGIGGQEAPEELARFESDVLAETPALVIWQVGTNAIFHRELYDPHRVAATIATGVEWLRGLDADVILMDLQYAPALLSVTLNESDRKDPAKQKSADEAREADTRLMVSLIAQVARVAHINLFPRFALMEQWVKRDGVALTTLIEGDGLHQTEQATACVTAALDAAIGASTGELPGTGV